MCIKKTKLSDMLVDPKTGFGAVLLLELAKISI
jgi:hypothetical protein